MCPDRPACCGAGSPAGRPWQAPPPRPAPCPARAASRRDRPPWPPPPATPTCPARPCPAARRSPPRLRRSSAAPLQGLAGDDHLLDLAGALVDAEDAHVAVKALDPVLGDVAGAAEDLHGL